MYFNDFKYYNEVFQSGVITDRDTFNTVITEANALIKQATHGRITQVTEDIQNAICSVCDVLVQRNNASSISSESLGNHSVSYQTTTTNEWQSKINNSIHLYLADTGLLYRGLQ
jgi:hypothetical protein